jgi:hypothetical protein
MEAAAEIRQSVDVSVIHAPSLTRCLSPAFNATMRDKTLTVCDDVAREREREREKEEEGRNGLGLEVKW